MRMVRRMRVPLLACCLALATPALADRPPPLGVPWNGPGANAPVPTGKPPPLPAEPAFATPRTPSPNERAASTGTGFVVAEGRGVTNRHVIKECARVVAQNAAGARLPVRVLAADADRDLAVLWAPPAIGPPFTFRDQPPVRRGE